MSNKKSSKKEEELKQ